jgi:N-acetylglucosamine kinase-like BadF-type ATPase
MLAAHVVFHLVFRYILVAFERSVIVLHEVILFAHMSRNPLVLGVDGGGTKSIGMIADPSGNTLTRRESGASNVNVVGLDGAARSLYKVIMDCCNDVRCSPDELRSVMLAVAGAGDDLVRTRIKDAVTALFQKNGLKAPPLAVDTDARAALEGAFNGGIGIAIVAGTGSIVIGKTARGDLLMVGGWGRLIGDEGSGYYLGREVIRAVTLQLDKRAEATVLKQKLADRYHWETRADVIRGVYQDKTDLAQLAPLVLEAAAENDLVSQKIISNAALLLTEQVRVIVMNMGILRKIGLVMLGGLIDHENVYSNTVQMKLMKLLPHVEVRQPMNPPAHGAVLMALERLRKE